MGFMGLGPGELMLIVLLALIVFGPGKLPDVGHALGKSIKEFRKATSEISQEISQPIQEVRQPLEEVKRVATEAVSGGQLLPSASAPAAHVCPHCSTQNPTSNAFCGKCGAPMDKEA